VRLIAYMCPPSLEIDISSSFFCTSGKETVKILKISHGQLAPCQENRIKGQQTVRSAGCKVQASNAGFLLASMPSHCRFLPLECCYSQSASVSVHQDKIWGSAIRPGLSGCLKDFTLAIWRGLSISFPAALRQESEIAESDARVARRQINSFSVNIPHLKLYVRLRTSGLHEYSRATVHHGNDTCSSEGWDIDKD